VLEVDLPWLDGIVRAKRPEHVPVVLALPGYYHFLEAIKDPEHPEHEDMMEWAGKDFDPRCVRCPGRQPCVPRWMGTEEAGFLTSR